MSNLGGSVLRYEQKRRRVKKIKGLVQEQVKKVSKKDKKKKKVKWIDYHKGLEDPRWFEKRKMIFKRDCYTCKKCGAKNNLQVHHLKYIDGRNPWEYNQKHLITLCASCHKKEHLPEIKAKNSNKILDADFEIALCLNS